MSDYKKIITEDMEKFDNLPAEYREVLRNAHSGSFNINLPETEPPTPDEYADHINLLFAQETIYYYGKDHPQVNEDWGPIIMRRRY